ncbi:hypothetical protein [Faecalimonas sp.]
MESLIRFSLFGNYERFSTNNLDAYMKLIDFFGRKGYKPATANELQLQPNGQSRVLVMPIFLNDAGAIVEISSNRINFQKNSEDISKIKELQEKFANDFSELIGEFTKNMAIEANRVALNCDILKEEMMLNMPTQSTYYDDANKTEMSVRNVARRKIENEESNIIIEKYVTMQGGFTKYSYDINSIGENQIMRFDSDNIMSMCSAYIDIAIDIEKGLK